MARRQQYSPLDDLVSLATKLPWWVSLLVALVSYYFLHSVASRPPLTISGPGQMGDAVVKSAATTAAFFGQLMVPAVFCIGAIVSGINSIKKQNLYNGVQARCDVGALNDMTWEDFETLVGEHFIRRGFRVSRHGGNGPDGGVDLVLRRGGETHLVQCKQWKAYKVGVQPVREFYGVMCAAGATGGYFVTSGVFTDDAQKFAQGLHLDLINGKTLKSMIASAVKGEPASSRTEQLPFVPTPRAVTLPPPESGAVPGCPRCGAEMVRRLARKGGNVGKEFWGCSTYPECDGTTTIVDYTGHEPAPAAPAAGVTAGPEKRSCPYCGTELVLKKFHSGPREGEEFYGCVPCRKGWPIRSM